MKITRLLHTLAASVALLAAVTVTAVAAPAGASAAASPATTTSPAAGSGHKRLVIIDQDAFGPAGSNMQAILMLLQSASTEVLGITITSGDGWRDEEVDHALRLLEIDGRTDVPVVPGAVFPLVNSMARSKVWESLYGKLVYRGAWTEQWPDQGVVRSPPHPTDPYLVPPSPAGTAHIKASNETAAGFMVRQVRAHPNEVTIIAAGPMTNLALAARLDPKFASLAQELVFMGGSFNPVAADNAFAAEYVNAPRREFNMRWDPEAASLVLHEPWRKITEVPVDPTTKTMFKPEFVKRVGEGKAPFAAYIGRFGVGYPMWDELAVAVWLDPGIVTRHARLLVDIDTSFTAGYGNSLSWSMDEGPGLGEQAVDVVQDIDLAKFEALTLDLLTQGSPK